MKEFALSIPGPGGTSLPIPAPQEIQNIPIATYGSNIIWLALELFLLAALLISLFMLIYGGFRFMTSGGSKQDLDLAKKTIVLSIIGLLIVVLSFTIINFIAGFFGVPIGTK